MVTAAGSLTRPIDREVLLRDDGEEKEPPGDTRPLPPPRVSSTIITTTHLSSSSLFHFYVQLLRIRAATQVHAGQPLRDAHAQASDRPYGRFLGKKRPRAA